MNEKNLELSAQVFGRNLRRIRVEEKVETLEKFSESTGLGPNHISEIERGKKIPRLDTILKLRNAGININEVLDEIILELKKEGRDIIDE